jgi:hypothetical protein
MAYTPAEIIVWMKICQPLARRGEAIKSAKGDKSADVDLDMKLYDTRRDIEYEYAQDPTSDNLFPMGNFGLSLCGIYLFVAQATVAGGGSVTPITPGTGPTPYDFEVDSSSFIATGDTSKTLPASWANYNILFVRNSITQSVVNQGASYYSWDKTTRLFTLISGAAQAGELFQIYPVI